MVVNQLKVHPLSRLWFQNVNLHPYTSSAAAEPKGGLAKLIAREANRFSPSGASTPVEELDPPEPWAGDGDEPHEDWFMLASMVGGAVGHCN